MRFRDAFRVRCGVASLSLLAAVALPARAEWKVVSTQSEIGLAGVEYRHVALQDAASGRQADLDLAVFSAKSCTLRVLDNVDGQRLASVMAREHCLCGINGGYFDAEFKPIGLRIINGQTMAPLQRARLITGVLLASPRGVQIMRAREFSLRQKNTAAIQCGPFLVDRSQRVTGLNGSNSARRTFAATIPNARALIGVSSEVSLAELGTILSTPTVANLKVQRAMNFDGGSSTAFWFARENGTAFSISEEKPVRDFVAMVRR